MDLGERVDLRGTVQEAVFMLVDGRKIMPEIISNLGTNNETERTKYCLKNRAGRLACLGEERLNIVGRPKQDHRRAVSVWVDVSLRKEG